MDKPVRLKKQASLTPTLTSQSGLEVPWGDPRLIWVMGCSISATRSSDHLEEKQRSAGSPYTMRRQVKENKWKVFTQGAAETKNKEGEKKYMRESIKIKKLETCYTSETAALFLKPVENSTITLKYLYLTWNIYLFFLFKSNNQLIYVLVDQLLHDVPLSAVLQLNRASLPRRKIARTQNLHSPLKKGSHKQTCKEYLFLPKIY